MFKELGFEQQSTEADIFSIILYPSLELLNTKDRADVLD